MTDRRTPAPSTSRSPCRAPPSRSGTAIATGPGISSWLHPTRVDEHVGGAFGFDMGGSAEAAQQAPQGTVTAYDAPHRFVTEAPWSAGGRVDDARHRVAGRRPRRGHLRRADGHERLRARRRLGRRDRRAARGHGRRPGDPAASTSRTSPGGVRPCVEAGDRAVAGPPRAAFDGPAPDASVWPGRRSATASCLPARPRSRGRSRSSPPASTAATSSCSLDAPAPGRRRPRAPYGDATPASASTSTVFDAPDTDAAPGRRARTAPLDRPGSPRRFRGGPPITRPARGSRSRSSPCPPCSSSLDLSRPARRPPPALRASSARTPPSSCGSPTSTASSSPASSSPWARSATASDAAGCCSPGRPPSGWRRWPRRSRPTPELLIAARAAARDRRRDAHALGARPGHRAVPGPARPGRPPIGRRVLRDHGRRRARARSSAGCCSPLLVGLGVPARRRR